MTGQWILPSTQGKGLKYRGQMKASYHTPPRLPSFRDITPPKPHLQPCPLAQACQAHGQ